MEHVGAAVVQAQPVVRGAGIEQQRVGGFRQIGQRQNLIGVQIQDEEAPAAGERLLERGDQIAALRHDHLAQRIVVAEKRPGGLVLGKRLTGAHQPFVGQAGVEQRERDGPVFFLGDVDDRYVHLVLRGCRRRRAGQGSDRTERQQSKPAQPVDMISRRHRTSPEFMASALPR